MKMLINASVAVEVPAVEAVVYDSWVIKQMIFIGEGITRPAQARITFQRGKKNLDNTWVLSEKPEHTVILNIDDIYAEAAADPEVAQAVGMFLYAIDNIGKNKNIL
jgi:hypothetical protein